MYYEKENLNERINQYSLNNINKKLIGSILNPQSLVYYTKKKDAIENKFFPSNNDIKKGIFIDNSCSESLSKFSIYLIYKVINNTLENNININIYGLYKFYSLFYLFSIDSYLIETFFNYESKDNLNRGLYKINENISQINNLFIKEILITNKEYSNNIYSKIKNIFTFFHYKKKDDLIKINKKIKLYINDNSFNIIKNDKSNNILITFLKLNINEIFLGDNNKMFFNSFNLKKTLVYENLYELDCYYYKNEFIEAIEIKLNDNINLGLIKNLKGIKIPFIDNLNNIINKMKLVKFNKISFPKIKINKYIKLNSLLNENIYFMKFKTYNIFKDNINIDEIYQYINLDIKFKYSNKKDNILPTPIENLENSNNLIFNTPFIYYVKLSKTNTPILINIKK